MKLPCLDIKQKECLSHAKKLIEREDSICYDICAELDQHFGNVKHMTWFQIAVANYLIENVKKWEKCEIIVVE